MSLAVRESEGHISLTTHRDTIGTSTSAGGLCHLWAQSPHCFCEGGVLEILGSQLAVSDCGGLANGLAARSSKLPKCKPKIAYTACEHSDSVEVAGSPGIFDEAMV